MALMAAPQTHIDIVSNYLLSFGVSATLNPNKDMMTGEFPVHIIEKMLNTKLAKFESVQDKNVLIRATQAYYLPTEVASAVDIVGNLLDFPNWYHPRVVHAPEAIGTWPDYCGASCHGKIVPQVIKQQYSSSESTPVNAKNSMAVAEFQAQHYDQADLNLFTNACKIGAITVVDKNGGNKETGCSAGACIEALLDIEYLHAIGGNVTLADYWFQSYSLLDWINNVLADPAASLVHSVSYGNDEVQQTSVSYMVTVSNQIQLAGAKGLTIIFASGDQGVWGRSGHTGQFNPDFPAASPYVTAVGGSDLDGTSIGSPEICCQDSGGGFSNTFARPSYQNTAVQGYINSGVTLPTQSYWNASGRAYPDISAIFGLYIPYCIAEGGNFVGVAGTSAAAPVVAGIVTNLNNIQLNAGKAPLGFLNPWLYQTLAAHPDAFYDVTTGVNNGGAGAGFSAYRGWDPCTGVGTPIASKMAAYLP